MWPHITTAIYMVHTAQPYDTHNRECLMVILRYSCRHKVNKTCIFAAASMHWSLLKGVTCKTIIYVDDPFFNLLHSVKPKGQCWLISSKWLGTDSAALSNIEPVKDTSRRSHWEWSHWGYWGILTECPFYLNKPSYDTDDFPEGELFVGKLFFLASSISRCSPEMYCLGESVDLQLQL